MDVDHRLPCSQKNRVSPTRIFGPGNDESSHDEWSGQRQAVRWRLARRLSPSSRPTILLRPSLCGRWRVYVVFRSERSATPPPVNHLKTVSPRRNTIFARLSNVRRHSTWSLEILLSSPLFPNATRPVQSGGRKGQKFKVFRPSCEPSFPSRNGKPCQCYPVEHNVVITLFAHFV